ncbi:hypothetical protein ACEQ8H_001557 [Pleosporales sp. CAS-2024a]
MRGRVAAIAAAGTLLVLLAPLFVLLSPSRPVAFFRTSSRRKPILSQTLYTGKPEPSPWNPPSPKNASGEDPAERLLIKLKLDTEDASWTQRLEPPWQNNIITIDSMYSHAHPKAHRPDKGRVATTYLTWIIENYHALPETIAFVPPADSYAPRNVDLPTLLNHLRIPLVQQSGFANLHCPTQKSTCDAKVLRPNQPPYQLRTLEAKIPDIWKELFGSHTPVPQQMATVLGAAFVVTRAQVQQRSADDYLKYWTWLNKTIMDDDSSGMLMEYLWPVIFGKDATFCPDPLVCECDLYGKCRT